MNNNKTPIQLPKLKEVQIQKDCKRYYLHIAIKSIHRSYDADENRLQARIKRSIWLQNQSVQ